VSVRPAIRTARSSRGRAALALSVAPWLGLAAVAALWARDRSRSKPGLSADVETPDQAEATEPGHGRLAQAPAHIPPRGWRDIAWRTIKEIGADHLPAVAAGITFYTLLAIFPAMGVFVSLYGLVADVSQVSRHLSDLAVFAPPQVVSLLGDQMVRLATRPQASLSIAFALSVMLSIWSANAGVQALFAGLNTAYDEIEERSYLYRRALSLGFTVGVLLFVTAVSVILVAIPAYLAGLGLDGSWLAPFRWVVLTALAVGAFAVLYRYGPARQHARWRWVRWGAVFAALAWIVGSLGFSWYVNHVAHYDATYGPLGAIVGFMMWIWVSVMAVLIGAELNAEIEHQTALDSTTGAALPMGARGATMADTVGAAFGRDSITG
jgi:membrane protein